MKIEIQSEGAQNVNTEAKEIAVVKPIETQVALRYDVKNLLNVFAHEMAVA